MSSVSPDEEAVFKAACEIDETDARAAYVARACGDDRALLDRVSALLRAHDEGDGFLESPPPGVGPVDDTRPSIEKPGARIGPYKLLDGIGEGGFGVVYMAEQEEPVRRRVALKVIKPGMDTKRVIARFDAERQALAMMDHPNVARVLDAGSTESGRPYFVMELIQGVPISEYCDTCDLTTRERLELFVQVCHGVQHAHQKGIIHRDVKPSNVLVLMQDGRPVAKVIDFGIAKAIDHKLTEATFSTGFAHMLGTPLYMSPEQAEMSPLGVDTRTDIYSLGVLLYELLTGTTPFEGGQIAELSFDEIRRVIRDIEPPTPSTRVNALGDRADAIARRRRTDPRKLGHLLRDDLDWIAMKAIEKDRVRRYETAGALAADVERYLADEPIEAGPPSRAYRLRKFARRNRSSLAFAGCLLVVFGVVAGSVGWVVRDRGARHAALEREIGVALGEAESSYRRGRLPEALSAVKRAEGIVSTGAAAEDLLRSVRRWRVELDMASRLESLLVESAAESHGRRVWVDIDTQYREAFSSYDLHAETIEPEDAAERIRRSPIRDDLVAGLDGWVYAKSRAELIGVERLLDVARRADDNDWRNQFRDALERRDRSAVVELAREDTVLSQPIASAYLLRHALVLLDERQLAIEVLQKAQDAHPENFWVNLRLAWDLVDDDPARSVGYHRASLATRPRSAVAHYGLGYALYELGEYDEAIAVCRRGIGVDPGYARNHNLLGLALFRRGDLEEAIVEYEKAIALDDHAFYHYNLGGAHGERGDHEKAIACLRKAIELDPELVKAHYELGRSLRRVRDLEGATAALRAALALDPEHVDCHINLGMTLDEAGKTDEAIAEFRRAIELDPESVEAHYHLGMSLRRARDLEGAIAAFRATVALDPKHVKSVIHLGMVLGQSGKLDEAIGEFRKALELDPTDGQVHYNIGQALQFQGRMDEAAAEYHKAIELSPEDPKAYVNLGAIAVERGREDEAINLFRQTLAVAPEHLIANLNLGRTLRKRGEFAEALPHLRKAHEIGSRNPKWPYPTARDIAECERFVELEATLPRVLAGEESVDARERIEYATLCYRTRRFDLAARFYEEAFAGEPALAENPTSGQHRYNAACAAALAGEERRRRQAREWLRADLEHYSRELSGREEGGADREALEATLRRTLAHWLRDPDLKGLRDEDELATLERTEREECLDLWRDARELLEAVGGTEDP